MSSDPSPDRSVPTLAEVYREHFRFVWRALRRLGVSEADTPDVLQEVFLVVHRRLGDFEGRSRMTTWLFGICMRVASDARRRAHVRRELPVGEAFFDARADSSHDIARKVEMRHNAEMLERWLTELPIEQSVVFTLFELEGMSGDQIAELMDIPVGTVRSRLRLVRNAIERRLGALDEDHAEQVEGVER